MQRTIQFVTIFITLLFVTHYAMAQCLTSSSANATVRFKTTGNASLDATINGEASTLAVVFGVHPTLYTLDDSQASNAFANCGDNTVSFGLRLLREELWSMERGGLAVAGIMAHEFAHVYQCSLSDMLSGSDLELQADYLAGWYLKREKSVYGLDVSGFARSLWSKGDYNFRDATHHGTPEQRVSAMAAGFGDSASTLSKAFAHSLSHLGWYDSGGSDSSSGSGSNSGGGSTPQATVRMCERQVTCQHMVACQHTMVCQHPVTTSQLVPCQHPMMTPYGPMPMHQADEVRNVVPMHDFDVAHAGGDRLHNYDVETYVCGG